MALPWALTATPAVLAASAIAVYYRMTKRKTRTKHAIAASYALKSARDRLLGSEESRPGCVCRATVNGLLMGLGKRYFCVSGNDLLRAINDALEDDPEALRGHPIMALLEAWHGHVRNLSRPDDVAFCELTLHYRQPGGAEEYVATWQYPDVVHFPPYDGAAEPASPRIVSAFAVHAGGKTAIMDLVRPWLGPRGNFYMDLGDRQPSLAHILLLLCANLRRRGITANTLVLLDNKGRAYAYDLESDAPFTLPGKWDK